MITKAGVVVEWLQESYGVGRGHAMALHGVIKNGPVAPEKHVGSTGRTATSRRPCDSTVSPRANDQQVHQRLELISGV